MKTLTLTDKQCEVLFDILQDTVDVIEGDLITTEDENGNEILEDISEYEAHKIYQQLIRLTGGF
jgi:DNA-binding MarR family transcriptional regulator